MSKTALIIGAGPAGLTAALELLSKTDIKPIVIEKTNDIGGISKTIVYNGNRIDVGGHRFFSKSELIMKWWANILPIENIISKDDVSIRNISRKTKLFKNLSYHELDPKKKDQVLLIRKRLSRIFFLQKFFNYPILLNTNTFLQLGLSNVIKIFLSYIKIKIFSIKKINSLEDFFINRFGKELYYMFFKDYTEKVWGKPCSDIAADWGSQRIKKLSISKVIFHKLKFNLNTRNSWIQNNIETSLINQFLYPKFGPGQMWETVASIIENKGGIIIKNAEVVEILSKKNVVSELIYLDNTTNKKHLIKGDYFFSTMPVKDLINSMGSNVNAEVKSISDGLQYRNFITVGLLLNNLKIKNKTKIKTINQLIPDTWIYIQDRKVKIGRLQIFNNWSPYLIANSEKVWIGLEYFCSDGDELWVMPDSKFINFAINELHSIGIIDKSEVIDSTIIRMPKAYPAYFGTYSRFNVIKNFIDKYENLFLIGRNGMHKYNNQDHSMLTAITAVNNIISENKSHENIWNINTENENHEE